MPKNTLAFLFILALLAVLLIGINIGKKMATSQYLAQFAPPPTPRVKPTMTPTAAPTRIPIVTSVGSSTYTDQICGFSITYTGSYLEQKTEQFHSTIITDPDNPENSIVTTCQDEIPKPPLPPDKIEDITLDGIPARLYHDTSSKDGSPRDEIFVTHPTLNHEIILAGYGPAFNNSVTSFRFLR